MVDGSYAPLATSGGDAENPTTTAVGRADRRPLLGRDGAVPAPAETSALARSRADPDPTPAGGSDPEWAAAGGTVEAWLARVDLADYAAKIEGYGYSSLRVLRDATEEDIVEMMEDTDIAMKKPHHRTMVAAWRKLALARAAGGGRQGHNHHRIDPRAGPLSGRPFPPGQRYAQQPVCMHLHARPGRGQPLQHDFQLHARVTSEEASLNAARDEGRAGLPLA
jgi:hypothetical protein